MKTTEAPHIVELQTRTERGAWERQAINVLAENPEQAAERAQLAATLAGKYVGSTYSAQKA